MYGCQMMQEIMPKVDKPNSHFPVIAKNGVTTTTLNDLWATVPKNSGRI
jgi:hypothetical protein